jgi:hypothetical protein
MERRHPYESVPRWHARHVDDREHAPAVKIANASSRRPSILVPETLESNRGADRPAAVAHNAAFGGAHAPTWVPGFFWQIRTRGIGAVRKFGFRFRYARGRRRQGVPRHARAAAVGVEWPRVDEHPHAARQ